MSDIPVPSGTRGNGCIPPEILSEIFKICCDLEHEHRVNVDRRFLVVAPEMYNLRHVCRLWRDTIDGDSIFWRQIAITLGETVTADIQAHLDFLLDRSGNGTVLHLDGSSMNPDSYPAVRWLQVRRLRLTSINLSADFWTRLVDIDQIELTKQFYTHTGHAVIELKSIKRVTLTESLFPEGLHLPSLVELDVDRYSMEHRWDSTQPISFNLGSALAKFQCRLTTLRIRQDQLPLRISNTRLTGELRYLRCLVVDFQGQESDIYGVGHEAYNEAVTSLADVLRVSSESRVLPSLEDARLTVKTFAEHTKLRIRTISALLVMLRSRAGCGMKVFGLHAYSHVPNFNMGPRRDFVPKLSQALPPVKAVDDLLHFRDIDVKMTSNGVDIFG